MLLCCQNLCSEGCCWLLLNPRGPLVLCPVSSVPGWEAGGAVYQAFFRLLETRLDAIDDSTMAAAQHLCARISRLPFASPADRVAQCKLATVLANTVLGMCAGADAPVAAADAVAPLLRQLPLTSTDRLPRLTALVSSFALELNA